MQWPQCATPPFMNHATPCNTLQYLAIPCYILLYSAIPCNTLQYHPACTSSIPAAFSLAILKWLPRQFLPLLLFTPFSPAAASLPFIMFNNRPFSRIIRHISQAAVFIPSAARFKWFPARYNHSVSACLSFQSTDNGALSLFADIIISPTTVTECLGLCQAAAAAVLRSKTISQLDLNIHWSGSPKSEWQTCQLGNLTRKTLPTACFQISET